MHARHTDDVGSFFKVVFSALAMVILGLWSLIYKALESKRERERLQMVSYKYSGEIAAMIKSKKLLAWSDG